MMSPINKKYKKKTVDTAIKNINETNELHKTKTNNKKIRRRLMSYAI